MIVARLPNLPLGDLSRALDQVRALQARYAARYRGLLTRLNEIEFSGFCLAEIPESKDPVRVMKYFRALWLAYQNLL